MKMIATERRNKLMSIIDTYGSVKVAEIAKIFNVSTETIRKDLKYLSAQGKVQKEFGGAVSINETVEIPLDLRTQENTEVKRRIAVKALELLKDKNVVYIDSGSTLLQFANVLNMDETLVRYENLALVTNSFSVVEMLKKSLKNFYFLGGEVNLSSMSTSGFWANYALATLRMDVAFMGTSGFQSHTGPCVKSFADADFKKNVIQNSNMKVVLADSSKFTTNAIIQYANWEDIDIFITDEGAPEEAVDKIRKKTKVILA